MGNQVDGFPDCARNGRYVLELAFDRVGRAVAASTPAAPIHRIDRESPFEGGEDRFPAGVIRNAVMHKE